MKDVLNRTEDKMKKTLQALEHDFQTLRTGRASAGLFEKIRVSCYGQETPLSQVASISVPEARLVVIQPWDKSLLGEIERAIQKSELSLNPSSDGRLIRIQIPPLTEERRKEIVKLAKNTGEQSKVALRNVRREANEDLKKLEKSKEISEDELKQGTIKIQELTDSFSKEVDELIGKKEQEILEV